MDPAESLTLGNHCRSSLTPAGSPARVVQLAFYRLVEPIWSCSSGDAVSKIVAYLYHLCPFLVKDGAAGPSPIVLLERPTLPGE